MRVKMSKMEFSRVPHRHLENTPILRVRLVVTTSIHTPDEMDAFPNDKKING